MTVLPLSRKSPSTGRPPQEQPHEAAFWTGSVRGAGAAAETGSPEIKQLDERIGRGEAALKEATERATKLAAAAQPAERQCYVVSNVGTLRVIDKAKQ